MRRLKIIQLRPETLLQTIRECCDIPEDTSIKGVFLNERKWVLEVLIRSDEFPEVLVGMNPPFFNSP